MTQTQKHAGLAFLFLAVVVGITAVMTAPYIPPLRDFDQTFYPAAQSTWAGENPYTATYFETDQGAPPDFFSPPWVLPILLPFGLLSLEVARTLWVFFLIGIIFLSLVLLRHWGLQGRWLFVLIALPWTLITILYGQVTAVVLLGVVWGVPEIYKSTRIQKSALILLLSFLFLSVKPQLGVLIAIPMILQLVWQRDRRLIFISVGGFLVLLSTIIITPTPLWLLTKSADVQQIAPHWMSTLERELLNWQLPLWIATVVRLLACIVMGLWAWCEHRLSPAWWSAWLACVLILTPYSRAYDGVLLLPLLGHLLVWHKAKFGAFVVGLGLYVLLASGELGTVLAPLWAWLLFVPWRQLWHGDVRRHPYDNAWVFANDG